MPRFALLLCGALIIASAAAAAAEAETEMTQGRYWYFIDGEFRLWAALPMDHPGQEVEIGEIYPEPYAVTTDELTGTTVVFWRLTDLPAGGSFYCYYDFAFAPEEVRLGDIDPATLGPYDVESEEYKRFTKSEPWIEVNDDIRDKAAEIVGDERNPLLRARLIYDWVLDNMVYEYPDPADRGAAKSFARLKGDCGEFSTVFCALCRAVGIPARNVVCVWFTEAGHAWAEILLPPYGWVPVDTSVGQGLAGTSAAFPGDEAFMKFMASRGIPDADRYYTFGNLYPNRLIVCVGNNIELKYPDLGVEKTFKFLQPGGLMAMPPAAEAVGLSAKTVHAGFYIFGDGCRDVEAARDRADRELAMLYVMTEQYEKAEGALLKKLEERPDDALVLLNLGQTYVALGKTEEAVAALEKCLAGKGGSLKPVLDVWAHNFLGVCYEEQGDAEAARAEFQLVLDSEIDFQGSREFAKGHMKELESGE
jgi:tetratricopeptide (TPR) repeat protein